LLIAVYECGQVLVQLPHKTGKIGVFEMSWQNTFREFIVLEEIRKSLDLKKRRNVHQEQ